jgi:hypothetical protein
MESAMKRLFGVLLIIVVTFVMILLIPACTGSTMRDTSKYPFVVQTIPADGSTDVAADGVIKIIFDDVMNKTISSVLIDDVDESGFWVGNMTLQIDPATDFSLNSVITVTVPVTHTNNLGYRLISPYTFSFTTAAIPPDTQPPAVLGTTPADGDQDVNRSQGIVIAFNDSMDQSVTTFNVDGSDVTGTWQNAASLYYKPSSPYPADTTIDVIVPTTFRDDVDLPMNTPYTFSFKTGTNDDTDPPAVQSTSPANLSVDVSTFPAVISITFDESMDIVNFPPIQVNGESQQGIFINPTTYTWSPLLTPFQSMSDYSVTVPATFRDAVGNEMSGPFNFSFKTGL